MPVEVRAERALSCYLRHACFQHTLFQFHGSLTYINFPKAGSQASCFFFLAKMSVQAEQCEVMLFCSSSPDGDVILPFLLYLGKYYVP